MLDTSDSSAAPDGDPQQAFERRAFVRHPRKLETLWQFLGLPTRDLTSGQIFDLSATGIGMFLDKEFEVGSALVIRLPTATLGWMSHLVRVRRCIEVRPGVFQIGCTFAKPLNVNNLPSHLGTSAAEGEAQ